MYTYSNYFREREGENLRRKKISILHQYQPNSGKEPKGTYISMFIFRVPMQEIVPQCISFYKIILTFL